MREGLGVARCAAIRADYNPLWASGERHACPAFVPIRATATTALCRRITTSIFAPYGRNGTDPPRMSSRARRRDTIRLSLGASAQTLSTRSSAQDARGRRHMSGRTVAPARSIRRRRQSSIRNEPARAERAVPTWHRVGVLRRDEAPGRGGRHETHPRRPHLADWRMGREGPRRGRQPSHSTTG